jgi:UDP-N-acetylmuramate: L-alanyl-gamma-D-glutamyl-meso-diaminopimelate ligase
MNVHLIAIGGSAMHNMAIVLHKKGFKVTGSDDEIVEPSKSRLEKYGLLPVSMGWDVRNIHSGLDAVILGMHARDDNPELIKARTLGLKIYSYPEYIYEQTKDKTRVVIGGSHGKTTITAMILHVLQFNNMDCDYLAGAQLESFETMIKLSKEAKIAILEGDEYLSSPIDRRPKFHLYKPDIALISGIAWDHINVFPTFENYVEQFRIFISLIEPNGTLIYCETDPLVKKIAEDAGKTVKRIPYQVPEYKVDRGITYLTSKTGEVKLLIFGEHNLMNLTGARLVCNELKITDEQFYLAIQTFSGASKRLELIAENKCSAFYRDFAHAPSKLRATTAAVKEQFPGRKLVACMELHTFSSLNRSFIGEYHDSMKLADEAIVYFNPQTIEHKKLASISPEEVRKAFGGSNVTVYTNSTDLFSDLKSRIWKDSNLLMMSSGNFNGLDFKELALEMYSPG